MCSMSFLQITVVPQWDQKIERDKKADNQLKGTAY